MLLVFIIAFYASSMTSSAINPASPLAYTQVINYGTGFDAVNLNSFTCPQAGVYWFFLTATWNGAVAQAGLALYGTGTTYAMPQVMTCANMLHVLY